MLAPLHAEAVPEDPRQPLAVKIAEMRHLPEPEDGIQLIARAADGHIDGISTCWWEDLPGWDHVLSVSVQVLPGARRQALGTLLLARSVEIAGRRGLRLIMGRSRDNVPAGAAFCASFGAERAMTACENRQDLRTVDQALVDRWIAEGPRRAPGYRLQFVAGSTPPDLAEQVATVMSVMNTAPRENLDVSDTAVTPDLLRAYEAAAAASGEQRWAYYAVEEATGQFVGLTDITQRPGSPDRVWVGDTGVEPSRRGVGLGKWLKAAITRRILDELPDVRWVITHNAGSNDAMLGINRALGFRVATVHTTWQIPADRLRERLTLTAGRA